MSPPSLPDSRQDVSVQGYDKLARFLGSHPQMMIFRAFSILGAKYSLYLQAQLSHLEKDLEDASRADSESEDPEKRNYQNSWWDMHRARKDEDWQIQKANEVGRALEKYYNWLLLQKKVHKLESARLIDINYLRKWLENPAEGNNFLEHTYAEGEVWDKPDLVSLCASEIMKDIEVDALTKWIHDMLPWFHEHLGCRFLKPTPADEEMGIGESWRYNSNSIASAISMTSTMLAALWPIAAIFVLNLVPHFTVRLAATAMFTLLFALTVNVITTPTRVQLFAATTAYVLKQFCFPKTVMLEPFELIQQALGMLLSL